MHIVQVHTINFQEATFGLYKEIYSYFDPENDYVEGKAGGAERVRKSFH